MSGKRSKKVKVKELPVCNLKKDMPSYEKAKTIMVNCIETNRRLRHRIIKIIHGYGSSGIGGTNRIRLRNELVRMCESGKIRDYITGEDFHSSVEKNRQYFNDFRYLTYDPDFETKNPGITIILIY